MSRINIFYLAVVLTGVTLFVLLRPDFNRDLSFFGFSESNETEINYNYPVVVDRILVKPGQSVKKGDTILFLSRRKSKESLEEEVYRISELKAEEALFLQKINNELEETRVKKIYELNDLDAKIAQVRNELSFKQSLTKDLVSVQVDSTAYSPLREKLDELVSRKASLSVYYDNIIQGLEREKSLGARPLRERVRRLEAELEFNESHKIIPIAVTAPADGLIGSISCKEEEHVPSFNTLISFYEPHSGLIRAFVHEDLTLEVNAGDQFMVSSLKNENIRYTGVVIGLGSRIVEIPSRLRKVQSVKSYGREVLIEIPKENSFLQKEKVSVSFMKNGQ